MINLTNSCWILPNFQGEWLRPSSQESTGYIRHETINPWEGSQIGWSMGQITPGWCAAVQTKLHSLIHILKKHFGNISRLPQSTSWLCTQKIKVIFNNHKGHIYIWLTKLNRSASLTKNIRNYPWAKYSTKQAPLCKPTHYERYAIKDRCSVGMSISTPLYQLK